MIDGCKFIWKFPLIQEKATNPLCFLHTTWGDVKSYSLGLSVDEQNQFTSWTLDYETF